jgi:hypothetical protein
MYYILNESEIIKRFAVFSELTLGVQHPMQEETLTKRVLVVGFSQQFLNYVRVLELWIFLRAWSYN